MALQKWPRALRIDRAGLVGADGRPMPAASMSPYLLPARQWDIAAADRADFIHMWPPRVDHDRRALRYPRLNAAGVQIEDGVRSRSGVDASSRYGKQIAPVTWAQRLQSPQVRRRAQRLWSFDHRGQCALANPLDEALGSARQEHEVLITIEEGSIGGFAAQFMQLLAMKVCSIRGRRIRPMIFRTGFLPHADRSAICQARSDQGHSRPRAAALGSSTRPGRALSTPGMRVLQGREPYARSALDSRSPIAIAMRSPLRAGVWHPPSSGPFAFCQSQALRPLFAVLCLFAAR